jgi:hypothetical protein
MKIKNIACIASVLLASLPVAKATTILTAWTFDNLPLAANSSPQPSAGLGAASAVGLGAGNPSIVSLSGSSSGEINSWQFGATGGSGGWNTNAAIGTQGARFAASTVGYYQIQATFDVYATTDAEAYLQVQYTTEGSIWHNATITSAGTSGVLANNTVTTNGLVVGSYVILTNNGTAAWDNQVTVDLTGISGVDNDPNFAIRIVNASTGTNCLDTTGAHYNNSNTSANWTFDNVVIQGVSFDTIAGWPFDNDASLKKPVNNPPPAISNNTANASIIGFTTTYTFSDGSVGSTNYGDITSTTPASSTPNALNAWRLRGQNPGNGWNSHAAIGTQGAEFDVSTLNYSNVIVTFDLYFTSQGEAKMCVLYTTNGWATSSVANLAYGANPTYILTNTTSANTVQGAYFFNNYGSIFYNDLVIDFTGVPNVDNNPNFGIRIVNAATSFDCVNYLNQPYNNASGNCRLDNVTINGQFSGLYAPTVTNSSSATVDGPFTNTFSVNAAWASAIKSIYVNGVALTNTAYAITSSNIVFTPSKAPVLQLSGLDYIVIYATGYTSAKVTQPVATGVAKKLVITQPAGPSASGGTLTANPSVGLTDQYNNGTTNPYAGFTVTATVSNSAAWTLGGSTVQQTVNGYCVFTDLTATVTGPSAVTGAAIQFSITGYTNSATHLTTTNFYSTSFNIGAPPMPFTPGNLAAIQIDTLGNNTTFSIIELRPSSMGQTNPINIVPISATGTNALRLSSSGSCGHLALSDDGTFLVFDAFQDGSSATADETFNLNRAVGTLNYTNRFTSPVGYESVSYGGSQARAACSPDNQNFIIDDKGGLYVNGVLNYEQNNISVRSFGGATWVLTAKVAYPPTPSMYQFANGGENPIPPYAIDWSDPGDNGPVNTASLNPPPDPVAQDFYMIATNGVYNFAYILDQNGGNGLTNTVISKWVFDSDPEINTWTNVGSWTSGDNGDTLFATTNGSGGVYLYYANGGGGQGGNQLIRLTDQTVDGPLNITSTNVIYTAPANRSIAGVTFVPQQTAYAVELTPPPILTAQAAAFAGSPFSVMTTPDDPTWRSSITGIAVNGSTLPRAAYDTNQVGEIVFNPAQSASLQSPGSKTIVISATGYSGDSAVQTLANVPSSILGGVKLSGGNMIFSFTNFTGLSFSVLATNNVAAPIAAWPVIGTVIESPAGSGNYQFTNSAATNKMFYILRQP